MAAVCHVGLVYGEGSLPSIVSLSYILNFGLDPIYSLGDIAIFIFQPFGLKLPIHAHF